MKRYCPIYSQQNGISERKNRVLKEKINSMLSYSRLSQGFWGEAMLTACYLLNRVPNKRNRITPYELWTKKKPNLNYLRVWGCRVVVRLPDPKLKTFGEKGIECIFVEYAEHSKAFSLNIHQIDVKTTFLNGELDEEVVSQLEYTSNPGTQHWQAIQRVLKYLKKIMDYRLMYTGYPSVLEGYTDASWISNTEDKSSTSVVGKEAAWLKNLLLEISLWVKPIVPISIRCDSAATLVKTYSQMYNGKSRHLGVRHSMIRKMITNGVISIKFVMSQQNLVDHLTKGVARDLVIKSAEGIGLKSNYVAKC
ncbi:zinc finger, CCHC-type containing protein [Tanacetum coccineum]